MKDREWRAQMEAELVALRRRLAAVEAALTGLQPAAPPRRRTRPTIQGVFSDGDGNIWYDSWAEATGNPPRKKLSELLTADQVLKWLERDFPDPPEDKDKPAAGKPG